MFYYATHRSTIFPALTLISLSYLMFAILLIAAINFRVFYEGESRFYAAIGMLCSFIIGLVGIGLLFRRRKEALTTTL